MQNAQQTVQNAIDRIPPDAWPMIDMCFRITTAVALVWLALSLIAWWRRRAYNLTVASTARRSKKAQPDFLNVDRKARAAAINRGATHEAGLDLRDAAMGGGTDPVTWGSRIVGLGAFLMSLFTLGAVIVGSIGNVAKMGETLQKASSSEKLLRIVDDHLFGTIVATLVVAWHIYKYFADRKWKER